MSTSRAGRLTILHDRTPPDGHQFVYVDVTLATSLVIPASGDFVLALNGQFFSPCLPAFPGHPGFLGPYCDGSISARSNVRVCRLVFEVPTSGASGDVEAEVFYRARDQPHGAPLADASSTVPIGSGVEAPAPRIALIPSQIDTTPLPDDQFYHEQACITFDFVALDQATVDIPSLRADPFKGGLSLGFGSTVYPTTSLVCPSDDPVLSGTYRTCVACFGYARPSPGTFDASLRLLDGNVYSWVFAFPEGYGSYPAVQPAG